MNIKDVRRINLEFIVETVFDGNRAGLARAMDISPSTLYRVVTEGKDKRNIGDAMARSIEQAAKKPVDWLDQRHNQTGEVIDEVVTLSLDNKAFLEAYNLFHTTIILGKVELPIEIQAAVIQAMYEAICNGDNPVVALADVLSTQSL